MIVWFTLGAVAGFIISVIHCLKKCKTETREEFTTVLADYGIDCLIIMIPSLAAWPIVVLVAIIFFHVRRKNAGA